MPDENGPFTDTDLDELNARLKDLDSADILIRKAVQAGLDIGEADKQSRDMRTKLTRVKTSFFPGK